MTESERGLPKALALICHKVCEKVLLQARTMIGVCSFLLPYPTIFVTSNQKFSQKSKKVNQYFRVLNKQKNEQQTADDRRGWRLA